ncbi:MAG: hypothetical protein LBG87_05665 [Spirochaetaceae bacterium]|jgi:hypothetical protein|nr:hypothetical protein [Spirochaetaceae bacterium]
MKKAFARVLGAVCIAFSAVSCENTMYQDLVKSEGEENGEAPAVQRPDVPAYTVSIAEGLQNGHLVAVPEEGPAGTVITLVPAPAVYYILKEVAVTAGSDAVPVEGNGGTEPYTFTMPASSVTVSAVFGVNPPFNAIPIYSSADLAKIGADEGYPLNGMYHLEADLTLTDWTPIGEYPAKPFTGVFNGNNHTVTLASFAADALEKQYFGIFAYTLYAKVKDFTVHAGFDPLVFSNSDVTTRYFGAVTGRTYNLDAEHIAITGGLDITADISSLANTIYLGGIAGHVFQVSVASCTIDADITAAGRTLNIGGVLGGMNSGNADATISISNCYYTGDLSAEGTGEIRIGGIMGYIATCNNSKIENSAFSGSITIRGENTVYAGGITGTTYAVSIENCAATGNIEAETEGTTIYAGGISGDNINRSSIARCSSSVNVSAIYTGSMNAGTVTVYAGGIAGSSQEIIFESSSSGTIRAENNGSLIGTAGYTLYAGGIAGLNRMQNMSAGTISACYSTATVTASVSSSATMSGTGEQKAFAGGIAGLLGNPTGASNQNAGGEISDCWYDGTVIADGGYAYAGGIAGAMGCKPTILQRCYAKGTVSAKGSGPTISTSPTSTANLFKRYVAGGIAGRNYVIAAGMDSELTRCLALNSAIEIEGQDSTYIFAGRVTGNNAGGVAGAETVLADNSANSAMTIKTTVTGGPVTGPAAVSDDASAPEHSLNGRGVAAQPAQSVYAGLGWDFPAVWKMGADGYPVLAWQN